MKITQTRFGDLYEGSVEIEINALSESKSVSFGNGEPEDMCLARDLNDALRITSLLKLAYEAGKANEDIEIIYLEE